MQKKTYIGKEKNLIKLGKERRTNPSQISSFFKTLWNFLPQQRYCKGEECEITKISKTQSRIGHVEENKKKTSLEEEPKEKEFWWDNLLICDIKPLAIVLTKKLPFCNLLICSDKKVLQKIIFLTNVRSSNVFWWQKINFFPTKVFCVIK